MKKFPEYKGLNLRQVNEEMLAWWDANNTFEQSLENRKNAPEWVFYEGPPSANGMPGIHHVMGRTIKDIFCRYKTQQGFLVNRKAGWDTHGLPIELGVEKELGITKEDIGTKISVEDYNAACRKAVMRYTDVWNNLTREMGYWVNMDDPYITYKPKYMESVWWLLKQIYDKKLMYKGYTIQPYSPKAGTGLSSHELNQPGTYQDVTDTTVVAMFKITAPSNSPEGGESPSGGDHAGIPPSGGGGAALEGAFLLAWTTTPWTLPSNTALTVGPKIDYVLVETFNQYTFEPIKVILGKPLVSKQFDGKFFAATGDEDFASYTSSDKKIPYRILQEFKGADLVGMRYEQLMPYALPNDNPENAFRVIAGDFVTTEDGTGIVHTAPTFGADDALVAKLAVPPVPPMLVKDENDNLVPLVDLQGKFRPEMGEYAGKYVKNEYYDEGTAPERSVDVEIAIKLKEENRAFKVEKYKHSYPNCWRTDKPILYYPLDSWFIKMTDVRERMVALNNTINWKPKATGEGRFGNWLANANDWNLSRSRYWGIPLPIWRTEDGKEEICIGSVEELKNEMAKAIAAGVLDKDIFEKFEVGNLSDANYDTIDLHKNIVDKIVLVSASGKAMKRESDLIDVWFDSGSMPYAQWHYPFSPLPSPTPALPEGERARAGIPPSGGGGAWPADFIAEGVDQTRGWFYTLHAISTMVFDSVAYKNVISNGLVLDKNGQKMSKRLGNAIDPFTTMGTYGADAVRWYMVTNAQPWDNLKFDLEGVAEVQRKFFGTLYNTYSFFALYANIDGFAYAEDDIALAERPEIDRWILSELNTLIAQVQDGMDSFEPTRAYRPIQEFVNDKLSNWYVRLCRRRFWKGEYGTDKIAAYQTLYTCLETVAKLGAALAPFYMDRLYQDLTNVSNKAAQGSVHLSDFPKSNAAMIDAELEAKMQLAQQLSSMVLSLRKKEKIKVRQPLQKLVVPVLSPAFGTRLAAITDLVLAEVNVKELEALDGDGGIFEKTMKPNFKTLGPKFGKLMKGISEEIAKMNQHDIATFEREGAMKIAVGGEEIQLSLEDAEIHTKDVPGMLVASEDGVTVALDIEISEALRLEGIARELVNRIQNLRKDSGLNVTDRIHITLQNQTDLEQAAAAFGEYIKSEVLGDSIAFQANVIGEALSFDDIESNLSIAKI